MRFRTAPWITVACLAGLGGAPAWAQEDEPIADDVGDQEGAGEESPVEAPSGAPAGGEKGEPPQVSESHVVNSGDTLWDLCSKYLNSPWYWPKIWSYNPQLTNPHWIYPGNEVRFYPSDENLPTNIQASRMVAMNEDDGSDGSGGVNDDPLAPEDLVRSVGQVGNGRTAPNSVWMAYAGYASKNAHERSGEITASEAESYMLSDYDRVYVKLKNPAKKGDRLAIYRVNKEVLHPLSGEPVGYAVEVLGGVEIVDTSPTVATAVIAQAFRPIERGDYVGAWPENFGARVNPTPTEREAKGYIIDTLGDDLEPLGEHMLVFIDQGRAQGVQRGNLFTVLTKGDGFSRETTDLPNEEVGQVMVIDVQDNSSTAIVTYSLRELAVGDKVEARP